MISRTNLFTGSKSDEKFIKNKIKKEVLKKFTGVEMRSEILWIWKKNIRNSIIFYEFPKQLFFGVSHCYCNSHFQFLTSIPFHSFFLYALWNNPTLQISFYLNIEHRLAGTTPQVDPFLVHLSNFYNLYSGQPHWPTDVQPDWRKHPTDVGKSKIKKKNCQEIQKNTRLILRPRGGLRP